MNKQEFFKVLNLIEVIKGMGFEIEEGMQPNMITLIKKSENALFKEKNRGFGLQFQG